MASGAPSAETLRRPPAEPPRLDPAGHVIECPWCGEDLAFAVTAGQWHNAGDGYADVVYVHRGCPAVDPASRSERPQLLQPATPEPHRGVLRRLTRRT